MASPFGKSAKKEELHPDRQKELERRAVFKNVKSVTPQGKMEEGSVTVSHGGVTK